MGNSSGSAQEEPVSGSINVQSTQELENNFQFVKKIQLDPCYGEVKILEDKQTKQLFALKSYTLNEKTEQEEILRHSQRLNQCQISTILKLISVAKDEVNELCSRFFKVQLVFEYFPDTLQQKMKIHKEKNQVFSEFEIYYFLDCMLSALMHFEQNGIAHSDIRPKTVMIGHDGKYKLSDVQIMTGTNAYKQFLFGGKGTCYLSPKLLKALNQRAPQPQHNVQKSDLFSLGMVAMEMATLQNINECYNFKKFLLKQDIINANLKKVEEQHGHNLKLILSALLLEDEESRFTYLQFQEFLLQHYEDYKNEKASQISDQMNNKAHHQQSSCQFFENTASQQDLMANVNFNNNNNYQPQHGSSQVGSSQVNISVLNKISQIEKENDNNFNNNNHKNSTQSVLKTGNNHNSNMVLNESNQFENGKLQQGNGDTLCLINTDRILQKDPSNTHFKSMNRQILSSTHSSRLNSNLNKLITHTDQNNSQMFLQQPSQSINEEITQNISHLNEKIIKVLKESHLIRNQFTRASMEKENFFNSQKIPSHAFQKANHQQTNNNTNNEVNKKFEKQILESSKDYGNIQLKYTPIKSPSPQLYQQEEEDQASSNQKSYQRHYDVSNENTTTNNKQQQSSSQYNEYYVSSNNNSQNVQSSNNKVLKKNDLYELYNQEYKKGLKDYQGKKSNF